jgi:hypothetical protein
VYCDMDTRKPTTNTHIRFHGGRKFLENDVYCHTKIETKLGNAKEQNFTFLERDHPLSTKPVLSNRHPQRRSLSSFSISVACFSSFSRSLFS